MRKESPVQSPDDYKSARDYFYNYIHQHHSDLAGRTRLAEDVILHAWSDEQPFSDLLELEEYLADLSDAIVLFVESAGSFAELGAFSASDRLRTKTVAVVNAFYSEANSFIAHGPLRRLMTYSPSQTYYDPWYPPKEEDGRCIAPPTEATSDKEVLQDYLDLSAALVEELNTTHSTANERPV